MADRAFLQGSVPALKLDKLERIIPLAAGRDRVGAVVAGLTVQPAMSLGEAVQGLILVELTGFVTGIAARFIEPWIGVGSDRAHSSMTIDAGHPCPRGHHIPEAAGLGPGMAVITAIRGIGGGFSMLFMHGFGKVIDPGLSRCTQSIGGMAAGTQHRAAVHQFRPGLLIMQPQNICFHFACRDLRSGDAGITMAPVTAHFRRCRCHHLGTCQHGTGCRILDHNGRELIRLPDSRRAVTELGDRDPLRDKMIAGEIHGAGKALACQAHIGW